MNTLSQLPPRLRGFALKGALVLALLGAGAVGAGATAVAQHGGLHGHMMVMLSDPADVQRLLQHVYIEVGATDAQKAQLEPLLTQAAADLVALRNQMHGGHGELLALLTQEHIDRAALEAARAGHVQAMDAVSRRLTQLIADVGDVLTPEQRKTLAARIAAHHGLPAP